MAPLKRLFGLREMAVNVPDKHVSGLKRAIKAAVNSDILPAEANSWVPDSGELPPGQKAPKGHPDYEDPNDPVLRPKAKGTKAPAVGKKTDVGYDPKLATRTSTKTKADPKPVDGDLDDDWFQSDEKPASGKPGDPPTKGRDGDAEEFPQFVGSDAFKSQNAPSFKADVADDDDDAMPSFNAHNYGSGISSWDNVPAWMRDPGQMPRHDGGSQKVPGGGEDQPAPEFNFSDDEPKAKKPGMLSRLFGRKKK